MRNFTCIVCPRGCKLAVDETTLEVTGNACPRGAEYARNEVVNPVRTVTSTVRVEGAAHPRCPVKTAAPVPKAKMLDVVRALDDIVLRAPVVCGQVVLADAAGTGVDIVATRDL